MDPTIKDFEAALAELEGVVKKLEEGDLPLEASLALYADHSAVAFSDLAAEIATEVRLLRAVQTELARHATEREHAYWRDVGTLEAYFDSNMDLVSVEPVFNLYNEEWPIYTAMSAAPPAKVVAVADYGPGQVADSILSQGVVISGGFVRNSVLSPWVRVEPGAVVENSVLMEGVVVASGGVVRNAILDKNVVVPSGTRIGFDREEDVARGLTVSERVVAVPKNHKF